MKKIIFDNSIHLGQFCINNEPLRIACKNSQISLSMRSIENPSTVVGVESFNENTYSDHIIWGLERDVQDIFYPFMDLYHSVKDVTRVPLRVDDSEMAVKISKEFAIDLSNALTCAVAIHEKADEIHSVYTEFKSTKLLEFLKSFSIRVILPSSSIEEKFTPDLENLYQAAFKKFKEVKVDLVSQFHR